MKGLDKLQQPGHRNTADMNAIEILLIEDNPDDLGLALYALRKNTLASSIREPGLLLARLAAIPSFERF